MFKVITALVLSVATLVGCATLEQNPRTSEFFVRQATARVIEEADNKVERANRVSAIATKALDVASGESLVIGVLEEAVREAINWEDLSRPDQQLVDYLVLSVGDELRKKAIEGKLEGDALVSARQVLAWVVDEAAYYQRE